MTRVAFLFPGQGSQKVGMGLDFVQRYPELERRWFGAADDILGLPLSRLCFEGPEDELVRTENTQPAVFVVSMAIIDVLRAGGMQPEAVAGHSLGEYAALTCAGVLGFAEALRLVRLRGELMAGVNESTPGTMAAIIGLSPGRVEELCEQVSGKHGGVVEPANYNEPEQTVISGEAEPVAAAAELARGAGARVVPLRVGAPFHCSLMSPLIEEFGAAMDAVPFADPAIPVVANVTGDYVRTGAAAKEALRRQVSGAVRWTETMRLLAHDGYDTFVEAGPGRVLTGFAMKIVPELPVHSAGQARRLDRLLG
ncbi:ACP S-malonyltransferase [Nonomuraea insulae]|uniref:Malonyl CoA-acyl carrier protein transacylase n=1 Tax=Nonomuraea insulae TaxID=1616787 RepID=A0ABW1CQY0_9ACTN